MQIQTQIQKQLQPKQKESSFDICHLSAMSKAHYNGSSDIRVRQRETTKCSIAKQISKD